MKRQVRLPRNIDYEQSARLQSRAITSNIDLPPGWELYVTNSNIGRARSNSKPCTVPLWATVKDAKGKPDSDFELYYVAHEAAHAWVHHNDGDVENHSPEFYKWFKTLCPPKLWHHELRYKKSHAKRAGIDPNPLVNLRYGKPVEVEDDPRDDAPVQRRVKQQVRPSIDYDGLITSDPKLGRAIKKYRAQGATDDNVKSYVRGWFKKSGKA